MSGPRRVGSAEEDAAAEWLAGQGYTIVRRRYKGGAGEIDILAYEGDVLVAIEVKSRSTEEQGLEAISRKKLRRMGSAVQHFLQAMDLKEPEIRFDAVVRSDNGFSLRRDLLADLANIKEDEGLSSDDEFIG